jgi:predicted nucleotidyltransferase
VDELVAKLRAVLSAGPPLEVAILFGSRARGRARPDSDVDVAILPVDRALTLADEHALADAIERATGHAVDVVRIDQANEALLWRVARDGVVLASSPPSAAPRLLARIGIAHDERAELEADATRRYRAALARGVGP